LIHTFDVDKDYADVIEILTLGKKGQYGKKFPKYLDYELYYEPTAQENGKLAPASFAHMIDYDSYLFKIFGLIFPKCFEYFPYKDFDLSVARMFMQLPWETDLEYQAPHTDLNDHKGNVIPHVVFLYYINDTDGDTYFFNSDKTEVIETVSPKKGRMAVFDGRIPHGAGIPTKNLRAVANFNFLIG
jgi:hypothetical protein